MRWCRRCRPWQDRGQPGESPRVLLLCRTARTCRLLDRRRASGTNFELSPSLQPLEPVQPDRSCSDRPRPPQAEAFGDGKGTIPRAARLAERRALRSAPKAPTSGPARTVDQIAAESSARTRGCRRSSCASSPTYLVGNCDAGYSCVYMNTISWRTPTSRSDGEQSARRLRAAVRRGRQIAQRQATAAEPTAAFSIRCSETCGLQNGRARRRRIARRGRIPRSDSRSRTAHSEGRGAGASRPCRSSERPVGIPDVVRRARQADVRPAGARLPGRHHAGDHVHAWLAKSAAGRSPGSACRTGTTRSRTISTTRRSWRSTRRSTRITCRCSRNFLDKLQSTPDGDGSCSITR